MIKTQINAFPPAWLWLVDEAIPQWVKKHYSPQESWKDKPFSLDDAKFFFKGIEELSDLFTEERPKGMPAYFQHPKYRSAYLLYFLPLQAAKFLTLFETYPQAIEASLKFAKKEGVLRIADLGVGPGTASLSFLLVLLNQKLERGEELPPVELHWFDTQFGVMKDGQALVEQLANSFPKLRGKVQIFKNELPWWKAPSRLTSPMALTLIGHVLNESTAPQSEARVFWEKILNKAQGGGLLLAEPASRRPAQVLSSLRDDWIGSGLIEASPTRIWGPCLHAGACPVAQGRDWCHLSVPVQIPGRWFRGFSEALGSERQWLKYSYLWIASEQFPAPLPNRDARRVISDPLGHAPGQSGSHPSHAHQPSEVLLCEPEMAQRWKSSRRLNRGDLISVRETAPGRAESSREFGSRSPVKPRVNPKPSAGGFIQPRVKPKVSRKSQD